MNGKKPIHVVAENSKNARTAAIQEHNISPDRIDHIEMAQNFTSLGYRIAGVYGTRDEDDWDLGDR